MPGGSRTGDPWHGFGADGMSTRALSMLIFTLGPVYSVTQGRASENHEPARWPGRSDGSCLLTTTHGERLGSGEKAGGPGPVPRRAGAVFVSWISSTDHKVIGFLYLITSCIFFG